MQGHPTIVFCAIGGPYRRDGGRRRPRMKKGTLHARVPDWFHSGLW
jgi:hypothetical protein